jgi:hypothetical protein
VFKDYGAMLDTFDGNFKPGTIQKKHFLSGRHGCITVDAMFYSFRGTIHLGLRLIKQVELYKNFRPFVPDGYWEDTCPRPSDEVLAQFKDESSKKWKTKVTAEKSAPHKNEIGLAVAAEAAKSDDSTESELSE